MRGRRTTFEEFSSESLKSEHSTKNYTAVDVLFEVFGEFGVEHERGSCPAEEKSSVLILTHSPQTIYCLRFPMTQVRNHHGRELQFHQGRATTHSLGKFDNKPLDGDGLQQEHRYSHAH
jgi:hypothetical protein